MIEKQSPRGTQARKRRGRETEHIVARRFAADGWPFALATGAGASGKDITGVPGVAPEVKARSAFSPMANLRQATANAKPGELPVVIMRPNGFGEATVDEWPVFLTFARFRQLLHEAGYDEISGAGGAA